MSSEKKATETHVAGHYDHGGCVGIREDKKRTETNFRLFKPKKDSMDLITTGSTTKKMNTKEIAELTGKRHDHVLRDVKKLIEQGVINAPNFGETSIDTPMPKGGTRKTPVYELTFKATMLVVTGYKAPARMAVIDRWVALEEGKAKPAMVKPEIQDNEVSNHSLGYGRPANIINESGLHALFFASRKPEEST